MEIRSSNESSFRQVYDQVFPLLMRVAYHVTYNKDVAEDICQEAFIRFYDKDMIFPSENDAKYWLIRVTKNLAINHVKRKAREKSYLDKLKKTSKHITYKDASSSLMEKESKQLVRQAIEQLPEKYKMVIVLKEYAGMNYKQISSVLSISESNVKVRVYRARKELETMLNMEEVNVP